MDLSKLDQNEKLALYAAIVVFLAGLLSNWGGLLIFSILAALGVAASCSSPRCRLAPRCPARAAPFLPASGSSHVGAAAVELLRYFGETVEHPRLASARLLFIVALIGSAVMAWAGWQALQREGGNWQFGMDKATAAPAAAEDGPTRRAPPETNPAGLADTAVDEAEPPPDA